MIPASAGPAQQHVDLDWGPFTFETHPEVALTSTGSVNFMGNLDPVDGYPVGWTDVGAGTPPLPSSSQPWLFPGPGKYPFYCNCKGLLPDKMSGTAYLVGVRALAKVSLASPNSQLPATYRIDASPSFVTDFTAHHITSYAFDFDGDGTFDQTSPEPVALATFTTSGDHLVTLRVTDDSDPQRVVQTPVLVQVPKVEPPAPNPTNSDDTSGSSTTGSGGATFPKVVISVSAVKRIKGSALRKSGLLVRVKGLSKGDRVRAVLSVKKRALASGRGTSRGTTATVRVRATKKGRGALKRTSLPKRMRLDVTVSGSDGFSTTKTRAVTVR